MIDTSSVGQEIGSVRFRIERSKLIELARALHDDDPIWHDPSAAAAAGFDALPMLPTATVLADPWRQGEAMALVEAIDADVRRLFHGQSAWEYRQPLPVGDELTATTRVTDVRTREGRRSGTMTVVTLETEFATADGDLVARRRDVLLERVA